MSPHTLQYPYTPLEPLLSTHTGYANFKKQLRAKHILYLEQLTSYDNSALLDWEHISPRLNKISTSRKPKWFCVLESQIITNSQTRSIDSQLNLSQTNSIVFTTEHYTS